MSILTIGPNSDDDSERKPVRFFLSLMLAGLTLLIGVAVLLIWPYL